MKKGVLFAIILAFIMTGCDKDKITLLNVYYLKGGILPIEKDGFKESGFSLISSVIKERKKEEKIDLQLGCFNFIFGTPEAYFTDGEAVIDLMNTTHFDGLLLGAREFYFGAETLETLSKRAKFPFLSANLVKKDGSTPYFIKPYILTKDEKTAVIALSPRDLIKKNVSVNVKGYKLNSDGKTVRELVPKLKNIGINRIVVISGSAYYGTSPESQDYREFMDLLSSDSVDLFIVRSSRAVNDSGLRLIRNNMGKKSKVIVYDADKNSDGRIIETITASFKDEKFNQSFYEVNSNKVKPDREIKDFMFNIRKRVKEISFQVLCNVKEPLKHEFFKQSQLGGWITDMLREETKADIRILNSGGIRGELKAGEFTRNDLVKLVPFGGNSLTVYMTGEQIIKILERSCSYVGDPNAPKGYLEVSGINFKYDSERKPFKRVIEESITVNGKPLKKEKKYLVGMETYLFYGGDGYEEFQNMGLVPENIWGKSIVNQIEDYIEKNGFVYKNNNAATVDINEKH